MPLTQEEFDLILIKHELWLWGEPEGVQADLSGQDLRHLNLDGAELSLANLARCDMRGMTIRGAHFMGTDLSGANLERITLLRKNGQPRVRSIND